MGYSRAGFDIIGVDINRQPNYPFEFIQEDALSYIGHNYSKFDVIHASPPCQAYTRKNYNWGRSRTYHYDHPDLLEPTRNVLTEIGLPYVIENLPEAPMKGSLTLCGTMFGLKIIKHRVFEANWPLPFFVPISCNHTDTYNPWKGQGRSAEKLREAQGTPWIPSSGGASRKEGRTGDLFNAIPPAYTQFIGEYLIKYLKEKSDSVLSR